MNVWSVAKTAAKADARLFFCGFLLFVVFLAEMIGGYWSGSQALVADAWHMISDVAAQGVGLAGAVLVLQPPSRRKTFGWEGIKIFAAALNGMLLVSVALFRILPDAWLRFSQPEDILVSRMLPIAAAGLLVNLAIHHALKRDVSFESDLNLQGVLLHVDADLAASVGVIFSGLLIWLFGWQRVDSIMSALIGCGMIIVGARFVQKSAHLLLGGVPEGVDVAWIEQKIRAIRGVQAVEDLHVWSYGRMPLATVHIVHEKGLSARARRMIQRRAGGVLCGEDIHHWAIQSDAPADHPHCLQGAFLP